MKKLIMLLFIICFILTGCGNKKDTSYSVSPTPTPVEPEEPVITKPIDPVKELIDNMTLDEKIGQMIIIGFEGTGIVEVTSEMISQYHPGGVILFKRNMINSEQLKNLTNNLNDINKNNRLPLFISVDEEGGRVQRLPSESKTFPSSLSIGRKGDPELAYKTGQEMGDVLASFGFNLNFAPVMDIFSNPKNTVIGNRAFGKTPDIVSTMGVQAMKGLQEKGIIPVIKHFPGHGDTRVDSHTGLPVVKHDMNRLDSFELIPFKEAIENGADAIMTAHIEFPSIDESGLPATLSPPIVTGLLRNELGFEGVIITDDMEMDAIAKNFGVEEAAVKAISAGVDIILMCHSIDRQKTALAAVKKAVEDGDISSQRINQSVERIVRLKLKYNLFDIEETVEE